MSAADKSNTPIPFADVLVEELRSFGHEVPAPDPARPPAERLREVYRTIRKEQPGRSALCLSGGGIRSATFALGAVQALAKAGLLKKFDYLSTVSGGGYLGSFLSAWIHSHPQGLDGVSADLHAAGAQSPAEPEVRPLRHLREFSNYIAPKLGLFSADGWTLVATALRNLLLNWTVFVLVLAGLLTVPWLGLLAVLGQPTPGQLQALLAVAFVCFAAATAYPGLDLPSLGNFRWRQKYFLLGWMIPLALGMLCIASWWAGFTTMFRDAAYPDAVHWLASRDGLRHVVGFLVAFSVAGSLLSLLIVVPAQVKSGVFRQRATFVHWRNIAGLIAAAILVVGVPGTTMLWWCAVHVFPNPGRHAVTYMTFAPVVLLQGFFLLNSLFIGATSWFSDDDDREWWARAAGWVGSITMAWLAVHALVFWVPQWIEIYLGPALKASIAASGGLLGFIAAKLGASDKTPAFLSDKPDAKKNLFLTGAALAFFGLLSCGVSLVVDRGIFVRSMLETVPPELRSDPSRPGPDPWLVMLRDRTTFDRFGMLLQTGAAYNLFAERVALALALFFGVGFGMGYVVNVNRFSLHATYRNRLVRAYLGAARSFAGADGRPLRQPHPFTGFDPADNLEITCLTHPRPLHVVNMTLNLVGGDELAWQERKADSFTATRLHCGNHRLGYRRSDRYADGLSLGTALAISGAAASPNQGYNSSGVLTFLMTLFNVRLGWWLGNPGRMGSTAWTRQGPRQATFPLFSEALGLTSEKRQFVNLSDGGHFENLAIYEMLRRRCRYLVVIDAEQDPDYRFEGLGGIVRKARTDMGIGIRFPKHRPEAMRKTDSVAGSYFALGEIDYRRIDPDAENGVILYIKPVLLGGEPTDVVHYSSNCRVFPHESTDDQFFSESQFESYRALGFHEMSTVLGEQAPGSIRELVEKAGAEASGREEPS